MIGKHQESSYYDEARFTTSKYYFLNDTKFTLIISFYMRTQPLSYKWTCSWIFLEFKGGVDTWEGFW